MYSIRNLCFAILLATCTNTTFALSSENLSAPAAQVVASCRMTPETSDLAYNQWFNNNKKVHIQADQIDFPERNIAHLSGYTELTRGRHRVYANELIYNRAETRAVAKGAVKFQTSAGDIIFTPTLRYYVATGKIVSGNASFIIVNRKNEHSSAGDRTVDSYGTASRITLVAKNVMYLENANITSCLNREKHTGFTARELRVDLNEGVRTAKQVKIRIAPSDRHDPIQKR